MTSHVDIMSVTDLEQHPWQVILPMEETVPEAIREWLTVFATSSGTTSEFVFLSALTSTSALIRNTTLGLFGSYKEKGKPFYGRGGTVRY